MEPLTPPGPVEPVAVAPPAQTAPTASSGPGGLRRGLLTAGLAIGLLVVGGSAVVLAASPEPSASTLPFATETPSSDDSSGTTDTTKPDCPEGADGGADGSDGDDGSTPIHHTLHRDADANAGDLTRSGPGAASIGAVTDPSILADVLATADTWHADHAAAAIVGPAGAVAMHGDAGPGLPMGIDHQARHRRGGAHRGR